MSFMKPNLINAVDKDGLTLPHQLIEKGGVAQIFSLKGGSRTWFALSCLGQFLRINTGDPPLSLWISEECELYPEALYYYWEIPLSRVLLVRPPTSMEVWKTAVDAAQTGLFAWIIVKTETSCDTTRARKLQLVAEKTKTRVLLLSHSKLPHWTLRASIRVEAPTP